MKTIPLYELYTRPVEEIEADLAKARRMKPQQEPTGQHLHFNIPYGDGYKRLVIKDFELELHLAKIRDSKNDARS